MYLNQTNLTEETVRPLVNLELADESPDDAEALRVVLAGEVPCRPHLEPARRARDPNVVLALLQRLQDEVGVRADHLHRGGHGGLQTARTQSDPYAWLRNAIQVKFSYHLKHMQQNFITMLMGIVWASSYNMAAALQSENN